jgi:hypothetical protein
MTKEHQNNMVNFLDQSHSALEREPNAKPITSNDLEKWAARSDTRLTKARRDKSHKLPAANAAHTDNSNEGKEQGRGGRGRGGKGGRGGRGDGRANGAQGEQEKEQEEEQDFVPDSCMVLAGLTSADDSEEIDIVNNSPDTPSGLQVSARDDRACVSKVRAASRAARHTRSNPCNFQQSFHVNQITSLVRKQYVPGPAVNTCAVPLPSPTRAHVRVGEPSSQHTRASISVCTFSLDSAAKHGSDVPDNYSLTFRGQ